MQIIVRAIILTMCTGSVGTRYKIYDIYSTIYVVIDITSLIYGCFLTGKLLSV